MGDLFLNGNRCTEVGITIPKYGAWSADVALAGEAPVSGQASIKVSTLEMQGTVFRSKPFAGVTRARVVAGGGGWRKVLPPYSYRHKAGVKASMVLTDVARKAGETVVVANDKVIGKAYVRDRARAERVLRHLTDGRWWVDSAGVTQTKERDTSRIGTPFTVISRNAGKGQFEIATEAVADWLPGRTFTAPTVPDVQSISLVSIHSGNDGKLRIVVLTSDDDEERMTTDLRSLVRSELHELTYAGLWEYTVKGGGIGTIDGTPTDSRMPSIVGCPMFSGVLGEVSTPKLGAKAIVAFLNMDPAKPVCVGIRGKSHEHVMTIESVVLLLHNFTSLLFAPFATPVIGTAVLPAITTALKGALTALGLPVPPTKEAQDLAAATIAAAMAPGAPGNTILPYQSEIAAVENKIANLSGLFPGIGAPTAKDD